MTNRGLGFFLFVLVNDRLGALSLIMKSLSLATKVGGGHAEGLAVGVDSEICRNIDEGIPTNDVYVSFTLPHTHINRSDVQAASTVPREPRKSSPRFSPPPACPQ